MGKNTCRLISLEPNAKIAMLRGEGEMVDNLIMEMMPHYFVVMEKSWRILRREWHGQIWKDEVWIWER